MTELWIGIGLIVGFLILLFFILVKPQMDRLKSHRSMILELKKGDLVLTAGGVVGEVVELSSAKYIRLKIAPDTVVQMRRSMVYGPAKDMSSL